MPSAANHICQSSRGWLVAIGLTYSRGGIVVAAVVVVVGVFLVVSANHEVCQVRLDVQLGDGREVRLAVQLGVLLDL